MQVTITDVPAFEKALSVAAAAITRKVSIPILSHLLVRVLVDGRVIVAGTDLETSAEAECAGDVMVPGSIAVPAKAFQQAVGSVKGTITLTRGKDETLALVSGGLKMKISGLAAADFPALPFAEPAAEMALIDHEDLLAMIDRVSFAMGRAGGRYWLEGALLAMRKDRLCMVATDGNRMAWAQGRPGRIPGPSPDLMIPAGAVDALQRALPGTETGKLTLAATASSAMFLSPTRRVAAKLPSSQFPQAWESVLVAPAGGAIRFDRAILATALDRAMLAVTRGDDVPVHIERTAAGTRVRVTDTMILFREEIESGGLVNDPPPINVSFNGYFLKPFLALEDGPSILMTVRSDTGALHFQHGIGDGTPNDPFRPVLTSHYVLMPMADKK
jgi:DNA polymerase-3 subunit beta